VSQTHHSAGTWPLQRPHQTVSSSWLATRPETVMLLADPHIPVCVLLWVGGCMQGGTYGATLLLGDTSCAAGLSWSLGQVHLPEDPQAAAAPKFLSAAFQPLSNTKPEIVHMFVSGRGGGRDSSKFSRLRCCYHLMHVSHGQALVVFARSLCPWLSSSSSSSMQQPRIGGATPPALRFWSTSCNLLAGYQPLHASGHHHLLLPLRLLFQPCCPLSGVCGWLGCARCAEACGEDAPRHHLPGVCGAHPGAPGPPGAGPAHTGRELQGKGALW
jgi:hypothetical protein